MSKIEWTDTHGPVLISRDEMFKKTHRQMFADMLAPWGEGVAA